MDYGALCTTKRREWRTGTNWIRLEKSESYRNPNRSKFKKEATIKSGEYIKRGRNGLQK